MWPWGVRNEKQKTTTDQEEGKRAKELGVGLPWRFALELSKVMTQDRLRAVDEEWYDFLSVGKPQPGKGGTPRPSRAR